MLRLMRKHARNWLMQVLLGIIIIVFVFYFGSIRGKRQAESIAIIDDKIISYNDFRNEYQNLLNLYRQRFGDNLTDDILKELNLKQQALDNLINRAITIRKADELKLYVSDNEIMASIRSYPAFQRDGVFDNRLYQQVLRYYRMSPEDFETSQKRSLKIAKLEELISKSVKVSEKEVYDVYRIQNEEINIEFIKIPAGRFKAKVRPTDDDLEKYLKKHSKHFRIPEKIQVKYIRFSVKDFADTARVSDKEVTDYYDLNKTKFTEPGGETLLLSEVKDKIIAEIKSAKGMNTAREEAKKAYDIIYQEEIFEDYASENGLKINTTEFFSKDNPPRELVPIKDVAKYVFSLNEGEISPLLSTSKGFYIIKFTSMKPSCMPTLSEVRKKVERNYTEEESQRLCRKEAEEILQRLKNGGDIGKIGLEVSETGLFVPNPGNPDIPEIGFSEEIGKTLFYISEKNPYPDNVFYVDGNFVIIKFKERGELNEKDFEIKKADLKKLLLKIKESEYFHSWIKEARVSMVKEGKIKITRDISKL